MDKNQARPGSRLIATRRTLGMLALAGITLAVTQMASGHHSQSEFDFKLNVDVQGKVSRVDWRSPHARLYVDVVDEKGESVTWDFELPSPTTLMRRGWKRDSLKPGDMITINGARARNFPHIAYARSIKDAGGKALFTGYTQIQVPEPVAEGAPQ